VVQQEFGGQQHQRLLKGSVQLAAQGMEHLRRCRSINDKHVGQSLCMAPHMLHHYLLPYILHSTTYVVRPATTSMPSECRCTVSNALCCSVLKSIAWYPNMSPLIVYNHLWHHCHASHASNEGRMSSTAQACDNLLPVFDGHTWVM